ncbi:hypothetical protein AAVH_35592 [Aphelenchoides avenae]|nr:hypothetical protein AAVH_35592 [Aphelenchus avenae]
MRTKVVLKRKSLQQRLGLGIAIENDDEINRIVRVLVEDIDPGSVAQSGGLKLGDEILTVNGVELRQCTREECLRLFDQAALSMKMTIRPYASRKDLKIRSQSQPKSMGKGKPYLFIHNTAQLTVIVSS